jgi:ubiquinone/menaquinone biosynthesis C-methylase UbiE
VWHHRRLPLLAGYLKHRGGKLLDLGCHGGYLSNEIARVSGAHVTGIDISPDAIHYAKQRHANLHFVTGDIQQTLPFPDSSFDTVTAFDVLEHIPRVEQTVREVYRVLKNKGLFVVGIPLDTMPFRTVWKLWTLGRGSVWRDVHVHEFTESRLSELIARIGFIQRSQRTSHWGMYFTAAYEKTS